MKYIPLIALAVSALPNMAHAAPDPWDNRINPCIGHYHDMRNTGTLVGIAAAPWQGHLLAMVKVPNSASADIVDLTDADRDDVWEGRVPGKPVSVALSCRNSAARIGFKADSDLTGDKAIVYVLYPNDPALDYSNGTPVPTRRDAPIEELPPRSNESGSQGKYRSPDSSIHGTNARCFLSVGDKIFIDGPCEFKLGNKGSFEFNDNKTGYFGYLKITSKGIGEGYWNQGDASRIRGSLGVLHKNGPCWLSEPGTAPKVKLCAFG